MHNLDLQRLARSSNFGEYSKSLSDMSRWSRSIGSMDEAQIEQMQRKPADGQSEQHGPRTSSNGKAAKASKALHGFDRHEG